MGYKGWDGFQTAPGEQEKGFCCVCGQELDVSRNVMGPTSSVEAMAGHKHLHDSFTCKNSGEKWHMQALAILQKAEETPSKIIEDQLKLEAAEIISKKEATKDVPSWRFG